MMTKTNILNRISDALWEYRTNHPVSPFCSEKVSDDKIIITLEDDDVIELKLIDRRR